VTLAEHSKNAALHLGNLITLDREFGLIGMAVIGVVDQP
jgi:hypothetical protein